MSIFSTRRLESIRRSKTLAPVIMALTVGLAGGLGAIVFRHLIGAVDQLFFEGGERALGFMGSWYVVVLPAVGLVIVSIMVWRWAPEARGHGVPEVMLAVRKHGGRIRPRVALVKILASAICIGSGGSVGREGPIVQIGSTFGSTLGVLLGLRAERVRLLLACGAAAAIGGTFNAPIAGVIFSLEVILGTFAARSFGLVVIASVASTALVQAVLGSEPAFTLTEVFSLHSPLELPIYLLLGLAAGAVAVFYTRTIYFLEDLFARWRLHFVPKAVVGGIAVGLLGWIGIRFLGGRYIFGVGYDGIEAALYLKPLEHLDLSLGAGMTITALLLLALMKVLATAFTLAGGGSGGVFAPALFVGAMLGGAFGLAACAFFPGLTAQPGAYALVGMAALFAGAAHAPITSVLILFEMTDNYQIILPLMSAVVVSYLVASALNPDSIYSIKLRRRGGLTPPRGATSSLDLILVADAMSTDCEAVRPDESVIELASRFHSGHLRAVCVVDSEQRLQGVVTLYDVEDALLGDAPESLTAQDVMIQQPPTCTPNEPLRDALAHITDMNVESVPVVDREDPTRLLGLLRREEIFWAFGELATEHRRLLEMAGLELTHEQGESVLVEFVVGSDHVALCFKPIREIPVPGQCLIAMLRRAQQAIIPRGDTVIEPGDVLVLITNREREDRLRSWLASVAVDNGFGPDTTAGR